MRGIWGYRGVYGGIWKYMLVYDGIWKYMEVYGAYMVVYEGICRFMKVYRGGRRWCAGCGAPAAAGELMHSELYPHVEMEYKACSHLGRE